MEGISHMVRRSLISAAVAAALSLGLAAGAQAQSKSDTRTLRFVPHSNLNVLDPIWTTQYMARNHGYMVYDVLFALDEKNQIKPQMVDKWSVSPDRKTWTFTLRDGLMFHDDKPVTSDDVIASLKRWSARDAMGQKLAGFVDQWQAVDAKTFRLVLKEPYGLVLDSFGKPSSNVPFIMPKRVAETDPTKQIEEYVGSGPFVFQKDQWKPGERAVYTKFAKYKPRGEPASGLAGGKVAKVDRVEFVILKDPQTMANAINAGEVDIIEQIAFEQVPNVRQNKNVEVMDWVGGGVYMCRPNHLVAPFNNEKVRLAAIHALGYQEPFLRAQVGSKEFYRTCSSLYPCGTPYASEKGMEFLKKYDIAKIRDEVKASGYDGSPIVVMAPTDLQTISKLPIVASQMLKQAGFNVDMQSMDWNSVVARRAKRDPANAGGWNMFCTYWVSPDVMNPIASAPLTGNGEKGWFGWAKDDELEKLRDQFSRATDEAEKKKLAEAVQVRAAQIGVYAHAGEAIFPSAIRKNVVEMVKAPAPVLWNISKNGGM